MMNETPTLTQLARRLVTREIGEIRDSEGLATAVVAAHAKFLTSVSSLVGVMGSVGLFRRSLRLTQAGFPPYTEVLGDEQNGLLNAIGICLRKQTPDVVREASVALLTVYLELLVTFIGERLTRQLVVEAWPELYTPSSQEKQV